MNLSDCFKIGYVAKTHGLKGEVTVVMMPECPDLSLLESVFLTRDSSLVPYFIKAASLKGDKAYVQFLDVDTIDKASVLKGASLYLPRKERPRPTRGEFYDDEVVGFEVLEESEVLGVVTGVMTAGTNRFLEVDYKGREILIPVLGPFIKSINRTKKKITVELPGGFLDI